MAEHFTGDLRVWLRREPQPSTVRAETPEGTKTIAPSAGNSRRKWADVEATLIKLHAHRVEALDKKDNVLRVIDLAVEQAEEEDDVLATLEPAKGSKFQRDLILFARLLKDAHRDGAAIVAQQNQEIFARIVGTMDMLAGRLSSYERAFAEMEAMRAARLTQGAGASADASPMEMMQLFFQGVQMKNAAAAANGAANGAPHE